MQKNILDSLLEFPKPDPLSRVKLPTLDGIPAAIIRRWKPANFSKLLSADGLASIPIDHEVLPCDLIPGGPKEASRRLKSFINKTLDVYGEDRNHPDHHATSGLSSHLHFGHISAHEMVSKVLDKEQWTPGDVGPAEGKNNGFWNTSESAEAFLDQVLTWRELSFNRTFREPESYDRFDSLPQWALKTLDEHQKDPRPMTYSLEQFEAADTHDELWNAAQREIVRTGIMHNYMRMLWGKKILHWSETPREALRIMIHLNNKYGIDGRDPNSYAGIFWVLGRFDRAWGPKRPIFGSVRYMTSDSARKKLRLKQYLAKFGPDRGLFDS
jgi:deoxyribodipyrimidine photo-lyase